MTRIITITSGKGGVGKTMLTANVSAALSELGKDVIAIDANLTTPNLGIHFGIPLFPTTLHDVIKGRANVFDAIYEYKRGLRILPAGISLRDLKGADPRDISATLLELLGKTDIILMDCSAGLGREALSSIESSDELVIVTNPDMSSVTDALKTLRLAEELGSKVHGVVLNRVTGKKHHMTEDEINAMLGGVKIVARVPEDIKVQEAISKRMPVVLSHPNSIASHEIRKVAHSIVGRHYDYKKSWHHNIFRAFR